MMVKSLCVFSVLISGFYDLSALSHLVQGRAKQPLVMVVFIHGTVVPLPSFRALTQTLKDHSHYQYSFYDRYCYNMRFHSFTSHQPIQELGLHAIKTYQQSQRTSSLIAEGYEKMYRQVHGNRDKLRFFTFGWNGKLSIADRTRAADVLYWNLLSKVNTFKRAGYQVKIHLLAHSHGGNVALYLANNERVYGKKLSIDQLVLLGTPVQAETERFIHAPLFKRAISISSQGDLIQRLDYISTLGGYCRSIFTPTLATNSKLLQIAIDTDGYHATHGELWFYGDPSVIIYRSSFPLFPLPISTLIPHIVALAGKQEIVGEAQLEISLKNGTGQLSLCSKKGKLLFNNSDKRSCHAFFDWAKPFKVNSNSLKLAAII